MTTFETETSARAELERLQGQLRARESTRHFAHAAVAFFVALILAGAAGKMAWDQIRHVALLEGPTIGLALGTMSYALARYVLGRRALRAELGRFEALVSLRRQLRLDDPSALLPS